MYFRHLEIKLKEHLEKRRDILILLGARQVGKTTILKKLFPGALFLAADVGPTRQSLNTFDPAVYRQMFGTDHKIVVIDEIHLLKDPGRVAKLFYDQIPDVKLIVTGSSSFRIKNKTSESLAGRKVDYHLFPLTFSEYLKQKEIRLETDFPVLDQWKVNGFLPLEKAYLFDLPGVLENVLTFGLYPALVSSPNDRLYLQNLVESVVFKDLFDLSLIENRAAAIDLLRLLAYQIGSLVNVSEIASKLKIEARTVRRYLSLFEQSYIIFQLKPFSKRARAEIGKMPKIYFYDVGLRNALIDDFSPMSVRSDAGAVWENFVVSEIIKANYYGDFGYDLFFWRTKQGSEMDLVLQKGGSLIGLEIKSGSGRANLAFKNRYPEAKVGVVTKQNLF